MAATLDSTFAECAGQLRSRIDGALRAYTDLADGCPGRLRAAMQYSLLAPGKRLRPMLVLWASQACAGDVEKALPGACAVEMVHTYSLIHDDLPAMDNDDLRRGQPTCHKTFGEAMAILAGDALLTLAFEVLAKDVHPPDVAAACCWMLAEAAGARHLVGGQADDVAAGPEVRGIDALESTHHRKTGALIRVSLRLGATIAGANQLQTAALDRYGRSLGLAFQILDDLLDVRGEEARVGKRVGKDSDQGKLTFPGLLGVDESVRRAEQLIADACEALRPFGARARHLETLASSMLERDR